MHPPAIHLSPPSPPPPPTHPSTLPPTPPKPDPKSSLPGELWNRIFDLASDEDIIFDHAFPTAMAECTWFRHVLSGEWMLRTPEESLELIQRRSYATKKAIISTCKQWRQLGSEFLYRCLFFDDPSKLLLLSSLLSSSSPSSSKTNTNPGWWTKRIHLAQFYAPSRAAAASTMASITPALVSLIRHCPNLEIFIAAPPIHTTAFGPIADALCTHAARSLRAVHWRVPTEALPKVIWALDSLPALRSLHLAFHSSAEDAGERSVHLGAAAGVHLHLPHLRQLSLHGSFQDFLEHATSWALPALHTLSFDFGDNTQHDLPDVLSFLLPHGAALSFLDLNCAPALDVPTILDVCPLLTAFCFNADWPLRTPPNPDATATLLAHRPHARLAHVGLHGLLYAFNVGFTAASADPLRALLVAQANDRTVAALDRGAGFPALRSVRALSRGLLWDLNEADGPQEGSYVRWERWWEMCVAQGVRLEDCTGGLLGNLPGGGEGSFDDDGDDDEEEEEGEEGEEESWEQEEGEGEGGPLGELRELLEECRRMSAEREEPRFAQMAWQGAL